MTVKEYLGQAYRIDQRINSKIEQIASLRNLAIKATTTLSDTPPSGTHNVHRMENIIIKIADMEDELNADIDRLVNLKKEIMAVIKSVENPEQQTLLELRYMCFKTWEEIAVEMGCTIRHIYRLRDDAIKKIIVSNQNVIECH